MQHKGLLFKIKKTSIVYITGPLFKKKNLLASMVPLRTFNPFHKRFFIMEKGSFKNGSLKGSVGNQKPVWLYLWNLYFLLCIFIPPSPTTPQSLYG